MSIAPLEPRVLHVATAEFQPRYNLTDEELAVLDRQMVDTVKEVYSEPGVYAAIVEPNHPFSNFIRGHEGRQFPEVAEFSPELEENTLSFALVDTRPESDRVVHVGSISGPGLVKDPEGFRGDHRKTTGFLFVDDLIDLGNFTAEEFNRYYADRGIDLKRCIAVETNVRVGEGVDRYHGAHTADLGYLTLIGLIEHANPGDDSIVFASINKKQTLAFRRLGVRHMPLMERDNLVTPESLEGRISTPVEIPYDEPTRIIFDQMGPQLLSVRFSSERDGK